MFHAYHFFLIFGVHKALPFRLGRTQQQPTENHDHISTVKSLFHPVPILYEEKSEAHSFAVSFRLLDFNCSSNLFPLLSA